VCERRCAVEREIEIVDVAVPPILAWFVGLDYRVVLRTEVRGGVPVRRVVAAADVATGHAHPQVYPVTANAQAVLATDAARRDVGDLVEVTARHGDQLLFNESFDDTSTIQVL
jgi:hypothetical protein